MNFFKKKHKNEELAKKVSKIIESTPKRSNETPHKINTDVVVEIPKNEGGERSFKPSMITSEIRHPLALRGDQKIVGENPDIPNKMQKKLKRMFENQEENK